MNEWYEALKGFTDLPLAVLSLVFALLLRKKGVKNGWPTLFALVAGAAALGAVVHGIALTPFWSTVVWVVLHPLLFESVRRFGLIFATYVDKKDRRSHPVVFAVEAGCYLLCLVLLVTVPPNDIYPFAAFAVLIFIQTVVAMSKAPSFPKRAAWFLVILAVPLLLQIGETVIPYAVAIEHLFLALDLYLAYRMALTWKTEEKSTVD